MKPRGQNRIDFLQFESALELLAEKRLALTSGFGAQGLRGLGVSACGSQGFWGLGSLQFMEGFGAVGFRPLFGVFGLLRDLAKT